MIPYNNRSRPIRRDPICREIGRPLHQNGEPGRTDRTNKSLIIHLSIFRTYSYEDARNVAAEHGLCTFLDCLS